MSNKGLKLSTSKVGCSPETRAAVETCVEKLREYDVKVGIPELIDSLVKHFAAAECYSQFSVHQNGAVKGFVQLEAHFHGVKKATPVRFELEPLHLSHTKIERNPFDPEAIADSEGGSKSTPEKKPGKSTSSVKSDSSSGVSVQLKLDAEAA